MAEYEDGIFSNLPQRRGRAGDDNSARSFFRELRGMYVPEGPLPPRPHSSGKGGPSLGVSNAPPAGSASPTITGTPAVGQTLSCSPGVWFNAPTSYTYQWKRDGTVISGATSATYVVVAGDLGHTITCTVTATNAFGSTPATSNAVSIVALPANTAAPVISGSLTVGSTLSCTQGTWTNSPTSYAYQWQRGGTNISGATSSSYTTVTADGGTSVGCLVSATNAAGSASQASNTLAIAGGVATSVWSAADASANGMTLSNGGLTVTNTVANKSIRGTVSRTAGKLYVEFLANTSGTSEVFGLASAGFDSSGILGSSNYSGGVDWQVNHVSSGFSSLFATSVFAHTGGVWSIAVDFAAGSIWMAYNGFWLNSLNDPSNGAPPILSFVPATVGALFPTITPELAGDVWTLQPTAASQTYAPPAGFTPWDGGSTHSAQALAYLARTVGGNEGGNGTNIANLIDGLVSDGVWAKLDALYVLAQQNQTDANLNLVSTNYTLPVTTAIFAAYQGYSNFPATGGIDTGFNPNTAPSPHYTLLSASAGVWVYAPDSNGGVQIGDLLNGALEIISNFNLGGTFTANVNCTSVSVPTPGPTGLFAGDTAAQSIVHPYWNGVDQGAQTGAGSQLCVEVRIGGVPSTGWGVTTGILSAAHIGASLGSVGQLALYNRLRTYMTSIGVP